MERPWAGPWANLVFQDREHAGLPMERTPSRPMALPMPAHVHALLATMARHGLIHGEGHGKERLLIHCEAGLGRAPALAIVAAMAIGMDAHEAVHAVAMAVPEASPNRLILKNDEVLFGQAIVVHAQYAWLYRRGPAGAQGEAIGLRRGCPPMRVLPGRMKSHRQHGARACANPKTGSPPRWGRLQTASLRSRRIAIHLESRIAQRPSLGGSSLRIST